MPVFGKRREKRASGPARRVVARIARASLRCFVPCYGLRRGRREKSAARPRDDNADDTTAAGAIGRAGHGGADDAAPGRRDEGIVVSTAAADHGGPAVGRAGIPATGAVGGQADTADAAVAAVTTTTTTTTAAAAAAGEVAARAVVCRGRATVDVTSVDRVGSRLGFAAPARTIRSDPTVRRTPFHWADARQAVRPTTPGRYAERSPLAIRTIQTTRVRATAGHTTIERYVFSGSGLSQYENTTLTLVEVDTNIAMADKSEEHNDTIRCEVEQSLLGAVLCVKKHVVANLEELTASSVCNEQRNWTEFSAQPRYVQNAENAPGCRGETTSCCGRTAVSQGKTTIVIGRSNRRCRNSTARSRGSKSTRYWAWIASPTTDVGVLSILVTRLPSTLVSPELPVFNRASEISPIHLPVNVNQPMRNSFRSRSRLSYSLEFGPNELVLNSICKYLSLNLPISGDSPTKNQLTASVLTVSEICKWLSIMKPVHDDPPVKNQTSVGPSMLTYICKWPYTLNPVCFDPAIENPMNKDSRVSFRHTHDDTRTTTNVTIPDNLQIPTRFWHGNQADKTRFGPSTSKPTLTDPQSFRQRHNSVSHRMKITPGQQNVSKKFRHSHQAYRPLPSSPTRNPIGTGQPSFNPANIHSPIFIPNCMNPPMSNSAYTRPPHMDPFMSHPSHMDLSVSNHTYMHPLRYSATHMGRPMFNPSHRGPSMFNSPHVGSPMLNPFHMGPSMFKPTYMHPPHLGRPMLNSSHISPPTFDPTYMDPSMFNRNRMSPSFRPN